MKKIYQLFINIVFLKYYLHYVVITNKVFGVFILVYYLCSIKLNLYGNFDIKLSFRSQDETCRSILGFGMQVEGNVLVLYF